VTAVQPKIVSVSLNFQDLPGQPTFTEAFTISSTALSSLIEIGPGAELDGI
jgi:hypothetical protein